LRWTNRSRGESKSGFATCVNVPAVDAANGTFHRHHASLHRCPPRPTLPMAPMPPTQSPLSKATALVGKPPVNCPAALNVGAAPGSCYTVHSMCKGGAKLSPEDECRLTNANRLTRLDNPNGGWVLIRILVNNGHAPTRRICAGTESKNSSITFFHIRQAMATILKKLYTSC
jgi:hypothetical protein